MVIDYRAFFRTSIPDPFPLPHIDDFLDKLQGAVCFNSLDLLSGNHRIHLRDEDVPFGHYEFIVLPFALTIALATIPAHGEQSSSWLYSRRLCYCIS